MGEYHKPYDGDTMKRILFFVSSILFAGNCFGSSPQNYSGAVTAGDFVYISGQVPIDPITGQMMNTNMETMTNVVIDYLQHLLHVKGCTLHQVVKTEVYLSDIRDYDAMNLAYGQRFNFQFPPARDVIQVGNLLNNAPVEISCIAYKKR